MEIIDNMITISIRPYTLTLRKAGLIGLILFCLSCLSAFAQSAFITVKSTPYDRQMTRIRPILSSDSGHKDESISISLVNHWIGNLRAIPYGFSALAQLKWRWIDQRTMHTPRFLRDMIVALLALVFSILFIIYSRNTGNSFWVYWAPYFLAAGALLLGIPVYLSQRRHLTQPGQVPSYR